MSFEEAIFLGTGGLAMLLAFVYIAESAYVHFRYQKAIDRHVHLANGQPYGDFGIFIEAPRLAAYGAGLLFPAIARKRGFYEPIRKLPRNQQWHLIVIFLTNIIGVLLMIVGYGLGKYYGFIEDG